MEAPPFIKDITSDNLSNRQPGQIGFGKKQHLPRKGVWLLFEVRRNILQKVRAPAASSSQRLCSVGKDSCMCTGCF